MVQLPAAHNFAHSFGCLVADRRRKTNEQFASAIHRCPGSKRKSQKVEALLRITATSVRILAVDDPRLFAGAILTCMPQAALPAFVAANTLVLRYDNDR